MKRPLIQFVIAGMLLFFSNLNFAQAPDLGSASGFAAFSSSGAVSNTGMSHLVGNIGTNGGVMIGFGNVNGVIHNSDAATAACATDLQNAFSQLNTIAPAFFPLPVLGNGDTLNPGVFSIAGNGSLNQTLTLNGQGNSASIFIFKIQGTFSSTAYARINLINGAQACNIFWKTEGTVNLATKTVMKGTIIAHNAAISMGTGVLLDGRAFSTGGNLTMNAVNIHAPVSYGTPAAAGPSAPVLGSAKPFGLYSANGIISNKGNTAVTGDVGTNAGLTNGYNPLKVTGTVHPLPDVSTGTCGTDLQNIDGYLSNLHQDIELLSPAQFGNGLVLTPHTYLLNTAAVLTDTLYLDAEGNANAVFVIKVNGALLTGAYSKVILSNGAKAGNVYWKVDGAINLSSYSDFKGTLIGNGAIVLNKGTVIYGRALTTDGALNTADMAVTLPSDSITSTTPAAPVLYANDSTNVLTATSALGSSEILVSEDNGAFVAYPAQINVGNLVRPAGYWKFKIKAAPGRNESAIVQSPAFSITTVTPAAPVLIADDNNNTLSASSPLGMSEILVSENDGVYVPYTGQVNVGYVIRPAGYWRFKIKSAPGRNESAIAPSPAFSIINSTPAAPVLYANDSTNVISASSPLGVSEILVSENGGSFVPYPGQVYVGNTIIPAGFWKFKIKPAIGRNESAVVQSPAFSVANITPLAPVIYANDSVNVIEASSYLGSSEIVVSEDDEEFVPYIGQISVGNVVRPAGYWKFKIKAVISRNESAVVLSPAFTITNTTPASPVLYPNDSTDVLTATSALGSSEILVSEDNGAFVAYSGQINAGNVVRSAGYWKFKIKAATGRNESAVVLSPAFSITNVTPAAPVLYTNDSTDVLTATSTLGSSEILVSEDNGAFVAYLGQINIGNIARPAGYWKFKIKAATGRNESAVVLSPAFSITTVTPAAPVLIADDNNNTLSASSPLGMSEILVSENDGVYVPYTGQVNVGYVIRPAGYWRFKIKSAPGRNESAIAPSPAFSIINSTPAAPVVYANDSTNVISASSPLGVSEILVSENGGSFVPYSGQVYVGNTIIPAGFWKFKIKPAIGRNESAVVQSPAFSVANITPLAPVIYANDSVNVIEASSYLGSSEIVVSEDDEEFVPYSGQISVGNVVRPAGYWKFKIKAVISRNESAVVLSPAFTITNTTPAAPVLYANDSTNIISASSPLGMSEILVSQNDSAFVAYLGQINVGNVVKPAGYWKFKIKAAPSRNESAVVPSPAFTITNTTPAAPVLYADDNNDILSASSPLGMSEILISEDNGAFVAYLGQINVGNVVKPAGYWKFKIKAAPGRNESAVVLSPASTITNTTPAAPVLYADDNTGILNASSALGSSEILVSEDNGAFVAYLGQINIGNVVRPAGYWKFKIKAAPGRNESVVVPSPAFTITNITPPAPLVLADDNSNTLSASSTLGMPEILVSENDGAFVPCNGQLSVGNVARPAGYWKFKIKAAIGRNESAVVPSPAFTIINTTPATPALYANDSTNIISASSPLGMSEILVSEDNGAFVAYLGQINIGNVVRPAGYWKFKIKAAPGRNESAVVPSPAFTITNITPPAPLVLADDNSNTLSASSTLGMPEILVSENDGAFVPCNGQLSVGNVARPAGYWKFKIKAAPGRNESAVVLSPAFSITNTTPATPVLYANDSTDVLTATSALGSSEIMVSEDNGAFVAYLGQINVGNVVRPGGYWKFKIKAAPGRNESAVVPSPTFSITNTTPAAPMLYANDNNDILSASSPLGMSEILVSQNDSAFVPYTGQLSIGNIMRPAGYWKFKIKAAPGRNESAIVQSAAFTFVPDAPTIFADDSTDVISASSPLGASKILVSENDGAFVQYNGEMAIGNVARESGYWKFKIQAAPGRTESAVVLSPAFSIAYTTPDAPVLSAEDSADVISASSPLGVSEILVSENDGPFMPYKGEITTGNVTRDSGYWKFKIQADTARRESAVVLSPAFNMTPSAPILFADDNSDVLSASSPLGLSEILVSKNGGSFGPYSGDIIVGNMARDTGYWKFKIKAAPGRTESAVVPSPAYAAVYITPDVPILFADDSADVISAYSALGNSELLVSENGGPYTPYTGEIYVGNVTRLAGYWKFKVKAARTKGRSPSRAVKSPAFTAADTTLSAKTDLMVDHKSTTVKKDNLTDATVSKSSDFKNSFFTQPALLIYPNPVVHKAVVQYKVAESGKYVLQVYNSQGILVKTIFTGNLGIGVSTFNLDGSNLSSGQYTCRLSSATKTVNAQLIVIK